jgi:hypothetical protein
LNGKHASLGGFTKMEFFSLNQFLTNVNLYQRADLKGKQHKCHVYEALLLFSLFPRGIFEAIWDSFSKRGGGGVSKILQEVLGTFQRPVN